LKKRTAKKKAKPHATSERKVQKKKGYSRPHVEV